MVDLQSGGEESAVTEVDHKRAGVSTEKGFGGKLYQYISARRSKLRLLTAKSNQIELLMEGRSRLVHIVQKEMKTYKKLYQEFIELNEFTVTETLFERRRK